MPPSTIRISRSTQTLAAIVLLAGLLRAPVPLLVPAGLTGDETSIGYTAYCIQKTFRDQDGRLLPFFSRTAGDYYETIQVYLMTPFVALIGPTAEAVRLPSFLIGTFTLLLLYRLVKETHGRRAALLAAFFLAISPWHVQFSRIAFRSIDLPFLLLFGLLLFVKSLRRPKYLPLAGLAFGASLFTYSPARVFIPLLMAVLAFHYRHRLWKIRGTTALAALCFLAISIPLFLFWITPEGSMRARATLIRNPALFPAYYLSYFSPGFLFRHGDPILTHSPISMGELLPVELLLVPLGILALIRRRGGKPDSFRFLYITWLILYPIPAALTASEHSLRAIVGAPLFSFLSGLGALEAIRVMNTTTARRRVAVYISAATAACLFLYMSIYIGDYRETSTAIFGAPIGQAIGYAQAGDDSPVYVSTTFGQIYSRVLFYSRLPPGQYQAERSKQGLNPMRRGPFRLGKFQSVALQDPRSPPIPRGGLLLAAPQDLDLLRARGLPWSAQKVFCDAPGLEEVWAIVIEGAAENPAR